MHKNITSRSFFLKRLFAVCLVFNMLLLTGCSIAGHEVYFADRTSKKEIFKMGSYVCPVKEFKTYLLNYKNIYTDLDGTDIYAEGYDTQTESDALKAAALEYLTKIYTLYIYASEQEIELDDTTVDICKNAAKEYYDSLTKDERRFMGVSEKDIAEFYQIYALAYQVNNQLMNSVDSEVSEDEARIMEAYVLFTTDPDVAATVQAKIDYGNTFERLAATYTELDTYKVTFGRGEYDQAIDDVVFNLDDGEVSQAISADGGYYFFQCTNKYNEELSEENKVVIVEKRQQQALDDITAEISSSMYTDLNEDVYADISLDDLSECKTSSFFTTIENALAEE